MTNDIINKLQLELNKEIKEESQVVYILSRIRKILELDKKEKKYKKLKFYCDWALHAEIENVAPIKEVLDGVKKADAQAQFDFITHEPFQTEFNNFLSEYSLVTNIYKTAITVNVFNRLLRSIYSDTPLVIKTVRKTKIILKEVGVGGVYQIEVKTDNN